MKAREANSLGQKFKVMSPETIEENDRLAKQEGATLEGAVWNEFYRGVFPCWRPLFCAKLEEVTGIVRSRDAEGNPIGEDRNESAYCNRVYATVAKQDGTDLDTAKAKFAGIAQECADHEDCRYDPSVKERKGGGSNLVPKTWHDIAKDAAAKGILANVSEKLAKLGYPSTVTGNDDASILSVAKAITARERDKTKERKSEYLTT